MILIYIAYRVARSLSCISCYIACPRYSAIYSVSCTLYEIRCIVACIVMCILLPTISWCVSLIRDIDAERHVLQVLVHPTAIQCIVHISRAHYIVYCIASRNLELYSLHSIASAQPHTSNPCDCTTQAHHHAHACTCRSTTRAKCREVVLLLLHREALRDD